MEQITPETIQLFGGRLCLDFANSVDWTADGTPVAAELDALRHAAWLTRWGRRMGLLPPGGPLSSSEEELRAAHRLRAAIHAVFSAIARAEHPGEAALDVLARDHAQAASAARLRESEHAWPLTWDPSEVRLVRFAASVDAVALLADPAALARVRRCPGPDCGWLFVDLSGRRRWCSMQTCGSRAKMRRLRSRARG